MQSDDDNNNISIKIIKGHKGIVDWAISTNRKTWNKEFRDQGVRLLALAQTFPDVPAGMLVALTEGKATVSENRDGTLTLTMHDGEDNE